MTTLSTSEVLNKAADVIEQRGWRSGPGWKDEGRGICLEGGIVAALGLAEDFDSSCEADYETFRNCPAYQAVVNYLAEDMEGAKELWEWNDRRVGPRNEKRSPGDVIATLRAAAVIEAAQERESVEV